MSDKGGVMITERERKERLDAQIETFRDIEYACKDPRLSGDLAERARVSIRILEWVRDNLEIRGE